MAFTREFPYETGTFVLVDLEYYDANDLKCLVNRLGVIVCYQCVTDDEDDELVVMVSGYKNSWCREYLLNEIRLATDLEVSTYKDIMGIRE